MAEFCNIDMEMVGVTLGTDYKHYMGGILKFRIGWIKYWFPEFEFTWLAVRDEKHLLKILRGSYML